VRLPDGFREYLCAANGGELSLGDEVWQIFPVSTIPIGSVRAEAQITL